MLLFLVDTKILMSGDRSLSVNLISSRTTATSTRKARLHLKLITLHKYVRRDNSRGRRYWKLNHRELDCLRSAIIPVGLSKCRLDVRNLDSIASRRVQTSKRARAYAYLVNPCSSPWATTPVNITPAPHMESTPLKTIRPLRFCWSQIATRLTTSGKYWASTQTRLETC